jgi:hypothetical protein
VEATWTGLGWDIPIFRDDETLVLGAFLAMDRSNVTAKEPGIFEFLLSLGTDAEVASHLAALDLQDVRSRPIVVMTHLGATHVFDGCWVVCVGWMLLFDHCGDAFAACETLRRVRIM